jgi:two-component system sensor histidine kinase CssS
MVISNDGSQISEDVIEKLFHLYEKGNDGQFGLGLSIVYRVATTYGYHVNAENMTDGVAFRVWKDVPKKERNRKEKAGKDTV